MKLTSRFAGLALICYGASVIVTAWLSDDALISFRAILNWQHGYGPVFNVGERVQVYTHPLWFLLLSGANWVTGNIYVAGYLVPIAVSLLTFGLFLRYVVRGGTIGILVAGGLVLSKAFVDYSTSALENPLSHLLLLLAFLALVGSAASARARLVFFVAAGAMLLNRQDLAVVLFPALLIVIWHGRYRPWWTLGQMALASLPVLAWTSFSVWYYGFPFPNTAYAKLGTGLDLSERLILAGRYYATTLRHDPLTLVIIVTGLAVAIRSSREVRAFATGVMLYLLYIISIGGDFMEGRFLTAPLLASALIIARRFQDTVFPQVMVQRVAAIGLAIGSIGVFNQGLAMLGRPYEVPPNGIADERRFYFRSHGLFSKDRTLYDLQWKFVPHPPVVRCGLLGTYGLLRGPGTHIIDDCALSDPLMARLPAPQSDFIRPGHFGRQIPTNYYETIMTGTNRLSDPATAAYYDKLRSVVAGPLDRPGRWRDILDLNLGRVETPDWTMYRTAFVPKSSSAAIPGETFNGGNRYGAWQNPANQPINGELLLHYFEPNQPLVLVLTVSGDDVYHIDYRDGETWTRLTDIDPGLGPNLTEVTFLIPDGIPTIQDIRVTAEGGDGNYRLGHFMLMGAEPPPPQP